MIENMINIIGIIVSFVFTFSIIGISTILTKQKLISGEGSRKLVHIGVSNWWIIAMIFFNNPFYAAVAPSCFVVINYIAYRKNIFKVMEGERNKKDLGTVYFAVSLLILTIITFSKGSHPYIGGLGVLIMGYGDGFAAVFGTKYTKHSFKIGNSTKTLSGTCAMFIFSFFVAFIVLKIYSPINAFPISVVLALGATIIEMVSPWGLDNLSVPLLTTYIYTLIR
ncbi:MAG: integral rane protein [Clostridiales bacterium]|nr:integral rane protein [Clostridiales bacterium]